MANEYQDAREELTQRCLDDRDQPYPGNAMVEVYVSDIRAVLEPPETIVSAAVRIAVPHPLNQRMWQGKRTYPNFMTVSAPPPARHGTLLHPLHELGIRTVHPDDQGFLTSSGRFVQRDEALKIALASGQPMIDHPARHDRLLFSEDLW